MTTVPHLRVLFFDVFGTSVAQRTPVADELSKAAQQALQSNVTISSEARAKATKMSYDDWFEFGGVWNQEEAKFRRESLAKYNNIDWRAVDKHRIDVLPKLLEQRGLGSLWDESQLQHLGRIWHRLTPWSDTCRGLDLLNSKFSTVSLSNSYYDLLKSLVAHSSIPFTHIYTADLFQSFKPNPKVYLGAAEKMGVKPEECGLVASHLNDLKGAKACGFYTIYVERPLEEKNPELREENIPDMWIKENEDGLITIANRLGI
ncbi:haloacid dehalogenase, type II [Thozetella sp. PMI_491]|nr:haloacid dehalogenase, type II [Thozetella sp. PMI_491]